MSITLSNRADKNQLSGLHLVSRGIQRGTFFLYSRYSRPKRFSRPFSSESIKYIVLTNKNAANQPNKHQEPNISDSPSIIIKTPDNIGFRTYPYGPCTISFFVGFHGAKVPFPIFAKRRIVQIAKANPIKNIKNPHIPKKISGRVKASPEKIKRIAGMVTVALKGNANIAFIQDDFIC